MSIVVQDRREPAGYRINALSALHAANWYDRFEEKGRGPVLFIDGREASRSELENLAVGAPRNYA